MTFDETVILNFSQNFSWCGTIQFFHFYTWIFWSCFGPSTFSFSSIVLYFTDIVIIKSLLLLLKCLLAKLHFVFMHLFNVLSRVSFKLYVSFLKAIYVKNLELKSSRYHQIHCNVCVPPRKYFEVIYKNIMSDHRVIKLPPLIVSIKQKKITPVNSRAFSVKEESSFCFSWNLKCIADD